MWIRKSKLNTLWLAPDERRKKEKVDTRGGKTMHCNGGIRSLEGAGVRGMVGKGQMLGIERNWNGIAGKEGVDGDGQVSH